jgi:hypothetical protein
MVDGPSAFIFPGSDEFPKREFSADELARNDVIRKALATKFEDLSPERQNEVRADTERLKGVVELSLAADGIFVEWINPLPEAETGNQEPSQ